MDTPSYSQALLEEMLPEGYAKNCYSLLLCNGKRKLMVDQNISK